jgi:hypothetical protein
MSGDDNLWYVKTPDGDVHRVTLDQLDEAFQSGRIDENVMVLAAGATKWAKLSELAGLDAPETPPAAFPTSLRPVSVDLSLDGLDDHAFKKKSRKGVVIGAALGIVAILGGILVANRAHVGSSSAAASTPDPTTAAATPPPAPAPDPTPAATADAGAAAASNANTNKLSDDQKAKLAAADKALDTKMKANKKNRAAASTGGRPSPKYKPQASRPAATSSTR